MGRASAASTAAVLSLLLLGAGVLALGTDQFVTVDQAAEALGGLEASALPDAVVLALHGVKHGTIAPLLSSPVHEWEPDAVAALSKLYPSVADASAREERALRRALGGVVAELGLELEACVRAVRHVRAFAIDVPPVGLVRVPEWESLMTHDERNASHFVVFDALTRRLELVALRDAPANDEAAPAGRPLAILSDLGGAANDKLLLRASTASPMNVRDCVPLHFDHWERGALRLADADVARRLLLLSRADWFTTEFCLGATSKSIADVMEHIRVLRMQSVEIQALGPRVGFARSALEPSAENAARSYLMAELDARVRALARTRAELPRAAPTALGAAFDSVVSIGDALSQSIIARSPLAAFERRTGLELSSRRWSEDQEALVSGRGNGRALVPSREGFGPFVIEDAATPLSLGDSTVVLRARHSGTGAALAMKIVRPHDARHAYAAALEVERLSALHSHRALPTLVSAFEADGAFVRVFERFDGDTDLAQLLEVRRAARGTESPLLTEREMAVLLADVAAGLCAAASDAARPLAHGWIHPSVVIVRLDAMGSVSGARLVDFDSAIELGESESEFSAGASGFRTPEQIGFQRHDPRVADTWALGVLGFVAHRGVYPFRTEAEVFSGKPTATPTPMSSPFAEFLDAAFVVDHKERLTPCALVPSLERWRQDLEPRDAVRPS